MSSYESLQTTIQEIVDAAINSDMLCRGCQGDRMSGWTTSYTTEGTDNPASVEIKIDNCGNVTSDPSIPDGDPKNLLGFDPQKDVFAHWAQVVPPLFTNWDKLPDPTRFGNEMTSTERAVTLLSTQADFGADGSSHGANPQQSDVTFLNDKMGFMQGNAIWTFQRNYTERLPTVIGSQGLLAAACRLAFVAEHELWTRAREDVASIADLALKAMKAAHPDDDHSFGLADALKVLGAVAAAATIVVTDGAAAPVVAGVATSLGIVNTFVTAPDKATTPKPQLGGSDPAEVCSHIKTAFANLDTEIGNQESSLISRMSESLNGSYEHPANCDLKAPAIIKEDREGQIFTLQVEANVMCRLARDVIPNIAHQLKAAKGDIDGAGNISTFDRPGGIGINPAFEYSELQWHLSNLLQDTAWQLDAAATHLHKAAVDFSTTDGGRAKAARDLTADTKRLADGSGAYTGRPITQVKLPNGKVIAY